MRVAIDFEGEGLLEGVDDREARLELLRALENEGFTLDELREAAAHDRLALLPVERVLAVEGKLYTREELAEETGLDLDFLDEAARALGVPIRQPGERAITEDVLELSRSAKVLLDAGLPPEAFLELTAVMSRSMANIAASSPGSSGGAPAGRRHGARPRPPVRRSAPQPRPARRAHARADVNLRMREQMREAVISQAELQSGKLAGVQPVAVGFVDIVGFTRLGEDVSPDDVGAVVRRFERAVADAVEPPVRLVKTIGDAAMLVAPEPAPVVESVWAWSSARRTRRRCCAAASRSGRGYRARRLVRPAGEPRGSAHVLRPPRQRRDLEGGARGGRRRLQLVGSREPALQGREGKRRGVPGQTVAGSRSLRPAASRSVSALSVFSQVKSWSSRPKWP